MTKEQFLNGTSFRVKGFGNYKGASTYKYEECISEESRSSVDNRVIITTHHCNVTKVGTKGFEGFTFVMNKMVKVKYKFEDLIHYEEPVKDIASDLAPLN
jgi:hypothetical protein